MLQKCGFAPHTLSALLRPPDFVECRSSITTDQFQRSPNREKQESSAAVTFDLCVGVMC